MAAPPVAAQGSWQLKPCAIAAGPQAAAGRQGGLQLFVIWAYLQPGSVQIC